jgi:phenylacetate-CoA ligase
MRGLVRPVRSSSAEVCFPALLTPPAAQLLAQLQQLSESQFWPSPVLREQQLAQVGLLLRHVLQHSPHYASQPEFAGLGDGAPISEERFASLPLLSRNQLLTQAARIHCQEVPRSHGATSVAQTSGATGQVVQVKRTAINQLMLHALVLRMHAWQGCDYERSLAVIRADTPLMDDDVRAAQQGWGQPVNLLYRSAPAYGLPIATDVREQAAWLLRRQPGYVATYPSNLTALLAELERLGRFPQALAGVLTLGETLTPETRRRCRKLLGADVHDNYSSQEVGLIAAECPESGSYHVQSESLIVEILDDAGQPCQPGQVGRVVVTDLHNFATPLIRYDLRDRAELGPACVCGRGLPTLARIWGRERNLVTLPTGERYWPLVGLHQYQAIAPILQYQVVQTAVHALEMRLVVAEHLGPEQEQALTRVLQQSLGYPFEVSFRSFAKELPRGPGGKFEEFVSELDRAPRFSC